MGCRVVTPQLLKLQVNSSLLCAREMKAAVIDGQQFSARFGLRQVMLQMALAQKVWCSWYHRLQRLPDGTPLISVVKVFERAKCFLRLTDTTVGVDFVIVPSQAACHCFSAEESAQGYYVDMLVRIIQPMKNSICNPELSSIFA
jgi:hypothetical protein